MWKYLFCLQSQCSGLHVIYYKFAETRNMYNLWYIYASNDLKWIYLKEYYDMILFLPAVAVKWVALQFDRGERRNRWEHSSLKTWGGTLMRRFGVKLSEIVIEMFLGTCDVVVLQSQGTKLWQASEGSSSDALDPVLRWRLARWQGASALDPVFEMSSCPHFRHPDSRERQSAVMRYHQSANT